MRIVIDIADELIDQWGCLIIEPVKPVQGEAYKPVKLSVPCFSYRMPINQGDATFRTTVGRVPQAAPPGMVTARVNKPGGEKRPDLQLHQESEDTESGPQQEPQPAPQPEPGEATPSEEEKTGDAEPEKGDKK